METLLYALIVFAAGTYTGYDNRTVSCRNDPLITTNCIDLQPPADDSFGATTVSLIEAVGANKRCKAACLAE
jgi:hypothetical protein